MTGAGLVLWMTSVIFSLFVAYSGKNYVPLISFQHTLECISPLTGTAN